MKKELICFDLDNTLIHSDGAHNSAYNAALKEVGLKQSDPGKMKMLYGRPHLDVVKALLHGKNLKLLHKVDRLHNKHLIKMHYKKARAINGAVDALKKLKKRYEIAILSNCSHRNILYLLKGAGIKKQLFNKVIGNDDVPRSKPWPDEILKAERILKHGASYMVGDTIYDIMAGKKAKVKTIAVLTGNHPRKKLAKKKPNHIINSVAALPGLLDSLRHKVEHEVA